MTKSKHLNRLKHSRDDSSGFRRCPICEQVKPLEEFPKKGLDRDGQQRYGYCKPCHSSYQRRVKLLYLFNLTEADYERLLVAQEGKCAICGHRPVKKRLDVDHEHSSGLIRGLLCGFCNRVIALFRDSPEQFDRAAAYLRTPPAIEALGEKRYGRSGYGKRKKDFQPMKFPAAKSKGGESVMSTEIVEHVTSVAE